jgi:hypothetical protein
MASRSCQGTKPVPWAYALALRVLNVVEEEMEEEDVPRSRHLSGRAPEWSRGLAQGG